MELHFSSANLQMRWGVVYLRLCTLLATYAYFSSSHLSWQKLSVVKFSILLVTMSSSRIGIAVASNYRSAANYYRERRPGLKHYLRYWRNLPFIVSRDFLFLSFKWCMILCKSVTKLRFDRLFLHFPSRASIFFLSHKLMIKQCIKSFKITLQSFYVEDQFEKANNTLFGQHRANENFMMSVGVLKMHLSVKSDFVLSADCLEIRSRELLPRLKRDIFHVFSIFLVSVLARVSLSIKALFFTTCTRNWFSKH